MHKLVVPGVRLFHRLLEIQTAKWLFYYTEIFECELPPKLQ